MKRLFFVLAVVLLAACSTPSELKRDYPPVTFKVRVGYQLVLKRLVENYQECAMAPLFPIGQSNNDVQNYPDLRSATIVRGSSGIGSNTGQVIEIRETAPNETEVSLTQRRAAEKSAALYERIANGGTGCE